MQNNNMRSGDKFTAVLGRRAFTLCQGAVIYVTGSAQRPLRWLNLSADNVSGVVHG